jgi:hypothetical protein
VSEAQRAWWSTRVAVVVASLVGTWGVSGKLPSELPGWLFRWDRWDAQLFTKVAHYGYQGYPEHYPDKGVVAFFPGLPVIERALHSVGIDYRLAGLLVSLVAGAVACAALARIAALDGGDARLPGYAVLALLLSPYAVFLAAGYSEALFLALALPAWLAARRGGWQLAGCLCALSCFVRVTGVFLAAALVVEYVVAHRGRLRPDALWLLMPGLAVLALVAYQHQVTGDWMGWQHAQRDVWGRRWTNPWDAFHTTWNAGFHSCCTYSAEYVWSFRAEVVAVLVGVALTLWLLWRRRWAETTYVGLQVVTLATSSFYLSVARASLLWWPLWIGLAQVGLRRPGLRTLYVAISAPIMLVMVVVFTQGRWVG